MAVSSSFLRNIPIRLILFQEFVFGDFSEQEAEKLFDDKQGVKVKTFRSLSFHSRTSFVVSMEYR